MSAVTASGASFLAAVISTYMDKQNADLGTRSAAALSGAAFPTCDDDKYCIDGC